MSDALPTTDADPAVGRPRRALRALRRFAARPAMRRWLRRSVPIALWTTAVVNALLLVLLGLAMAVPLPARDARWSQVVEYRRGME